MLLYICTCSSWIYHWASPLPPLLRVSTSPAKGPLERAAGISQFDFRPERSLIVASSLRGETKAPHSNALESRFLNWIANAVHIRSPTRRYVFLFISSMFCKLSSMRCDDFTFRNVNSCYNLYYYHFETLTRIYLS